MPDPVERDTVAFGFRVTFARDDGRMANIPDRQGSVSLRLSASASSPSHRSTPYASTASKS